MNSIRDIYKKGKSYLDIDKKDGEGHERETVLRKGLEARRIGVTHYFYIRHNFFYKTVT